MPSGGVSMSTLIHYSTTMVNSETWKIVHRQFALSEKGDNINVYCYENNNDGAIVHLNAITNNGDFVTDENDLSSNDSMLPESLKTYGSVALPHKDNYVYTGMKKGDKTSLLNALSDSSNWKGSNSERVEIEIDNDEFIITSYVSSATDGLL